MNVRIRKVEKQEEEQVVIHCVEITSEVEEIYSYILTKGKSLTGLKDGKTSRLGLEAVLYFEAVDEKVFAYTGTQIYEIKARLYEVEQSYKSHYFIRCSKSFVINLMQLDSISPALNGRFFAHMKNGEKIIISRQYVPALKASVVSN